MSILDVFRRKKERPVVAGSEAVISPLGRVHKELEERRAAAWESGEARRRIDEDIARVDEDMERLRNLKERLLEAKRTEMAETRIPLPPEGVAQRFRCSVCGAVVEDPQAHGFMHTNRGERYPVFREA